MFRFTNARKALAAAVVVAPLSLSLVACGSGDEDSEETTGTDSSTVTSTQDEGEDNADENGEEGEEGEENEGGEEGDDAAEPGEEGGNEPGSADAVGGVAGAAGAAGAAAGGAAAVEPQPVPPPAVDNTAAEEQDTSGVEAAIQNMYAPENNASMGAQWRSMQANVCRAALDQGWAAATQENQVVSQIDPNLLNHPDVLRVLDAEPAQGEPQNLQSINNVVLNDDGTANANVTVNGQSTDLRLVHEDGRWKTC